MQDSGKEIGKTKTKSCMVTTHEQSLIRKTCKQDTCKQKDWPDQAPEGGAETEGQSTGPSRVRRMPGDGDEPEVGSPQVA